MLQGVLFLVVFPAFAFELTWLQIVASEFIY